MDGVDPRRISQALATAIAAIDATLEENVSRAVRAKFYVQEVSHRVGGTEVKLGAVCRGEDNKEWASATPSGTLSMNVRTEACSDWKPGDEFYLDFTFAPKNVPGMDLDAGTT